MSLLMFLLNQMIFCCHMEVVAPHLLSPGNRVSVSREQMFIRGLDADTAPALGGVGHLVAVL